MNLEGTLPLLIPQALESGARHGCAIAQDLAKEKQEWRDTAVVIDFIHGEAGGHA